MDVNNGNILEIAAIVIAVPLPVIFSIVEYFIAKHGPEGAIFILPIVILSTEFVLHLYGIIFAAVVLAVGFVTRHVKKRNFRSSKKCLLKT